MSPSWNSVDEFLFDGLILKAIQAYVSQFDCGLEEAIDSVNTRIAFLSESAPERFRVPLAGFGKGVYT